MPDPAGMSRTEAAEALGLTRKSISNMLGTGRLRRVGWGLVDRVQVEELAAARAGRRRQHAPSCPKGSGGAWGGERRPSSPLFLSRGVGTAETCGGLRFRRDRGSPHRHPRRS